MWYFCTSLAALALFTSANCSCNYGTSHFPREASVPVNNFSYTGLTGPLNWYALNKTANVLCSTGTQQSPIDIGKSSGVRIAPGSSIQISIPDYPSGALFENLGTTVEVVVNGTMVEHRKIYNLSQFHFHTPSEHRIDDEYFALEMHFVFEAAGDFMAVIGVLIELGPTPDDLLASVFDRIDAIAKPGSVNITGPLYFAGLESHIVSNDIIRYDGSLTTPPCNESIAWMISSKPLYIDVDTFQKVKKVIKFNSRYTQNGLGMVNLLQNAANELNCSKSRVGEKGFYSDGSQKVLD